VHETAVTERRRGARRARHAGALTPRLAIRQALGAGVLVLAIAPGWWAFRPGALLEPRGEADETLETTLEAATPTLSIVEIDAHIRDVALHHGLSPLLVAAVVEAESEFNPRAVSRKGARGLMQLMPRTAASLQVDDPFDPFENIEAGVQHLRALVDRFDGDLALALAAYNAGETAVAAHRGVPPYRETRRYVARILRRIGRPDLAARALARPPRVAPARPPRMGPARERVADGERFTAAERLVLAERLRADTLPGLAPPASRPPLEAEAPTVVPAGHRAGDPLVASHGRRTEGP
jgi:hypothetical protein